MNNPEDYESRNLLILLLLASFITYLFLNSQLKTLDWDSLSYIMNAKSLAGSDKYYEWHRPILWPIVLAVNFAIFGFSELFPRILGALFSTLTILAIYKLASELYNKRIGLYAATIFSFLPLIIYWAPRMYSEIPSLGLASMAAYFVVKYSKNGKTPDLLFFGAFSALAFLTRFTSAAILLIGLLYLIYKRRLKKSFIKTLIIFSLVISPFLYFNWVNTGNPIYSMSIANYQMSVFPPTRLDYYVNNAMIIFTPVFMILFLIAFLDALKLFSNKSEEIVFIKNDGFVMSLLLFGFFFLYYQAWLNLKDLRYIMPTFIGFAILSGKGFDIIIKKVSKKIKRAEYYLPYVLGLTILLGYLIVVLASPKFFSSCNQYAEIGEYLSMLPEGNVISPSWPYYNYYSNKTVKWAPHTYEDLLNETQKFGIKYAVLSRSASEPAWAYSAFFDSAKEFTRIKTFLGCLGEISIYEYNGDVSGNLISREKNVVNSNAFIPLKFLLW